MADTILIVPCFNEEKRLQAEELLGLAAAPGVSLLFVDDGSNDGTAGKLLALKNSAPERIDVLSLPGRSGKGEAVRRGLLKALEANPAFVGFFDADLATPPAELLRLVDTARESRALAVVGDRSRLRSRDIRRPLLRRLLGRVFATCASLVLVRRLHDTQCGAKVFRASPVLAAALEKPFLSRWIFDVELLGRLLWMVVPETDEPRDLVQVGLREWHEKPGSHLKARHMVLAALELVAIAGRLARLRRGAPRSEPWPAPAVDPES